MGHARLGSGEAAIKRRDVDGATLRHGATSPRIPDCLPSGAISRIHRAAEVSEDKRWEPRWQLHAGAVINPRQSAPSLARCDRRGPSGKGCPCPPGGTRRFRQLRCSVITSSHPTCAPRRNRSAGRPIQEAQHALPLFARCRRRNGTAQRVVRLHAATWPSGKRRVDAIGRQHGTSIESDGAGGRCRVFGQSGMLA